MAKSVTLLKEALESDENSVKKYEEALNAMAREQSKTTVEGIIRNKKEHINSVKKNTRTKSKMSRSSKRIEPDS